ncbi:hypothetical protein M128_0665 [Bacteroides fragilis str. S6L8]|nr:hypothetical protein M145_0616 [Bacteroides fragilis str. 34-F-2 \
MAFQPFKTVASCSGEPCFAQNRHWHLPEQTPASCRREALFRNGSRFSVETPSER